MAKNAFANLAELAQQVFIDDDLASRLEHITSGQNEYGYDPFGFHPDYVKVIAPITAPIGETRPPTNSPPPRITPAIA